MILEARKGAKVITVKTEKTEEDNFELQSVWSQLSKLLKRMTGNQLEKAVEVVKLIISRRRSEIQRDTPHVDTAEALKRTIRSLIDEGVQVELID